jgi:hypothetical protein
MVNLRIGQVLRNKKVHRSAGAIAGFASALSVLVGLVAGYATPRGWGRLSMALHITKKPLIMKLAPLVTGTAAAIATAVGLLGFYLWLVERPADEDSKPDAES